MAARAYYNNWAVDADGTVVAGAALTLRRTSDDVAVPIYAAETGATLADPSGADGKFEFYAAPGYYTLTIGSEPTSATIQIDLMSQGDVNYSTRALLAADVLNGKTWPDGTIIHAGGHVYVAVSDSTAIADLSGLEPFGEMMNRDQFSTDAEFYTFVNAQTASAAYIKAQGGDRTLPYFGAKLDGSTDDSAALSAAIEAANNGEYGGLVHTGGEMMIGSAITPLTGAEASGNDNFSIRGLGDQSKITIASGAGTLATVFTLGDAGVDYAQNISISNLTFDYANTSTADPDAPLISIERGNHVNLHHLHGDNCGMLLDVELCGELYLNNWSFDFSAEGCAGTESHLRMGKLARFFADTVFLRGNHASNALSNGAIWRFLPSADQNNDTLYMHNCSSFSFSDSGGDTVTGGTTPDGKAFNVDINTSSSDSSFTNLWVTDCVFDHSTTAAFRFNTPSGSDTRSRPVWIANCRMLADSGKGIDINRLGTEITRGWKLLGNTVIVKDNSPALEISGEKFEGCLAHSNTFLDRKTDTTKDAAVDLTGLTNGGWDFGSNVIGSDMDTDTGFQAFIEYGSDKSGITESGTVGAKLGRNSWTPTFDFSTGGDLAISYDTQEGYAVKNGDMVFYSFRLVFTPTFTTSSGVALIKGFPFTLETAGSINDELNVGDVRHVNFRTSKSLKLRVSNGTAMRMFGPVSADTARDVDPADFTSGTQTTICAAGWMRVG